MPSIDKQKGQVSKKRLGRGLGSLLSTDAGDFEEKAAPSPKVAPINSEEVEGKRALQEASNPSRADQSTSSVQEKASIVREIDPSVRIWSLAIEKVIPNQTQPRKDFLKEPLEELSNSIKEQGVLQPITVRKKDDKYEIIAGERRWRASQLAGLQEIPAIIRNVDDQKSMELALIENLQREDLNPVEEAMGYQLLIDEYDLSQQDLATKVGKSRSSVTNALRVLTLPRDVRQMLRQGLISLGHAKVLLGVEDMKTQMSLARKTAQKKLSVRALEKEILKTKRTKSSDFNKLEVNDRLVREMASDLQKKLGTKVIIKYANGKGKIEISFYSDDELTNISDKLKGNS